MPVGKVIQNKGQGGIGRPAATLTHYSGAIFLRASAPTLAPFNITKEVRSLEQAEDLGIVSSSTDFNLEHYHISEFFRLAPKGVLFFRFVDVAVATTGVLKAATIQALQGSVMVSGITGQLRTGVVFDSETAYNASLITELQLVANNLETLKMPLKIGVMSQKDAAWTTYGNTADFTLLDSANVSYFISQDNNGRGKALSTLRGEFVSDAGAWLGLNSVLNPSQSVGDATLADITDATGEHETIEFITGEVYSVLDAVENDVLADKHSTFTRKIDGITGTYFVAAYTCTLDTSDYRTQERNGAMNEALRFSNKALAKRLNTQIFFNTDGTLTDSDVNTIITEVEDELEILKINGTISNYSVTIDTAQDVLTTGLLKVGTLIQPVGILENIVQNIEYSVTT